MPKGVKGSVRCGTHSGYQRHRRNGEEARRPCKDAANAANKSNKAKRLAANPPTFTIPVRCPLCEAPTEEINKRSVKGELVAVVKCQSVSCARHFLLRAFMAPFARGADGEPSKCGTEAGYAAHARAGEETCEPCRQAHSNRQMDRANRKRAAA